MSWNGKSSPRQPCGVAVAANRAQAGKRVPIALGLAPGAAFGDNRLERERQDEREPEDETPMQVRPQRHQREENPGRPVLLTPYQKPSRPYLKNRKHKNMRPGQQRPRDATGAKQEDNRGRQRGQPTLKAAGERTKSERRGAAEQDKHAAPAAEPIGERHDDFGKPFMRNPGRATECVGERVRVRNGAMLNDPLAHRDMQVRVAVVQDLRRKQKNRVARQSRRYRQGQSL